MSRLRFRVWDADAGRYIGRGDGHRLAVGLDGECHENRFWHDDHSEDQWTDTRRNAVIEQWTGLQDRNGRDIYEGDILTIKEIDFRHERDDGADREGSLWSGVQVVWIDCGFRLRLNQYRTDEPMSFAEWLEVTGNIHEHPHLLNPISPQA